MEKLPGPTSLIGDESSKVVPMSKKAQKKAGKLSNDELELIFSFLAPKDQQSMLFASKLFKPSVITTAKREQFNCIKGLTTFIVSILNPEENFKEIEVCKVILKDIKHLKSINLMQIKSNLSVIKPLLATQLKNVGAEQLLLLDTYCKENALPVGFTDFLDLAKILNKVQKINAVTDVKEKTYEQSFAVKMLCKRGFLDEALKIAEEMPDRMFYKQFGMGYDHNNRFDALSIIVYSYVRTGDIDKAIKVNKMITSENYKDDAQFHKDSCKSTIIQGLAERGDTKRVKELLKTIESKKAKNTALLGVGSVFVKSGNIKEAVDIVKEISSDVTKSIALEDIILSLLEKGDPDQAVKIAKMFPVSINSSPVKKEIVKAYISKGDFDKAEKYEKTIKSTGRNIFFRCLNVGVSTKDSKYFD